MSASSGKVAQIEMLFGMASDLLTLGKIELSSPDGSITTPIELREMIAQHQPVPHIPTEFEIVVIVRSITQPSRVGDIATKLTSTGVPMVAAMDVIKQAIHLIGASL